MAEYEPLTNVIRRSVGLPSVVMSEAMSDELADFKRQIGAITGQLRRSDGTVDVEKIFELPQKIDDLGYRLDRVESYMPKEFTEKDVYEVNKRIERLEMKVALISSVLTSSRIVKFLLRNTIGG
jgi:hypothetical protein